MAIAAPRDVLDYWFSKDPASWFQVDPDRDAEVRRRFGETHKAAMAGELDEWAREPQGALALVLVLDQMSRNIHRGTPRAFAGDARALAVTEAAVGRHFDVQLPEAARRWLYMPYMHSEVRAVQERGLSFFLQRLEDAETQFHARQHADIIRRFGRFPHRNAILGRRSSEAEESFLADGGFAG